MSNKSIYNITEADRAGLEEILKEYDVIKDQLRYLSNLREQEFIEKQEKHFNENLKGNIFVFEDNDRIEVVKVVGCKDWSPYNSCRVIRLSSYKEGINHNSNSSISHTTKDTVRVDMLGDKYKLATPEKIEQLRQMLYTTVDKYLHDFQTPPF